MQKTSRVPAWWPSILAALAIVLALVVPSHAPTLPPALTTAFGQLPAAPLDPTQIAPQTESSVVQIGTTVDYQGIIGNGAGVVIDSSGIVLTANHVVAGADRINATSIGTGRTYSAQLLGYDRTEDIAVIQLIDAGSVPAAPIGNSAQVVVGDPIVGLGNANGNGNPITREQGQVSGLNQDIVAEDELTGSSERLTGLIGIAAPLRPGDSGGPLVNTAGQVIGINVAASVNYRVGNGRGFAIPINKALAIAGQIQSRTPSSTVHVGAPAMLGVGVGVTEQRGTPGVVIRDVLRGTPAEAAGLRRGDVVTAIDGASIDSPTTLTNVLDQHYPGDVVDLTWLDRTGAQRTAKVTLAAGPDG